ncbi:hypothetical protein BJV82DRAFT_710643 [Fennellomyces sp. T-0311]|nr:hypothetical protein BJV82DRAFT_710643 [Fennellomyces sp. T-0311]
MCRSLRSLIFKWSGMWKTLSTFDGHTIMPNLTNYKQYIQGSDVKYLRVDEANGRRPIALAQVIDFLSEKGCTSIEHIEFCVNWVINTSFLDTAAICSNSLTRVDLTITRYMPSPITLDQILLRCPSLRKSYFVSLPWQKLQQSSSLIGFQHHNLIDLALYVHDQQAILPRIDIGEYTFVLSPYLMSTSKLQRLCLGYTNTNRSPVSLPSLHEHCPSIVSFYLSKGIEGIMYARETDWLMQQTPVGLVDWVSCIYPMIRQR